MSLSSYEFVFVPRYGDTLIVVIVARISTVHQDSRSLDDQVALVKKRIQKGYHGKIEWRIITSRASGEYLDRDELVELEKLIESGQVDVVACEDLARICRRTRAYDLCESAVDKGVRLLALNDQVDTSKDGWQMNAIWSVFRHESYNRDTSARIRRTQRNRFQNGGMVKQPLFCYTKPLHCKSDADLEKNTELEPTVLGIFDRLEQGWSFSRVADWLNANQIPLGVHCKCKKWDGAMVRRVVFNPILKGVRVWNAKRSVRINKTGRRRQVNAAVEERIERQVSHLAFVNAERYDLLISNLTKKGELYSVPKRRGDDPRKGRSKKRTRWPGQHVFCDVCGKMFVYGGHGKKQHMMCSGAREYSCWNGVTFDAGLAARRMSAAVFEWIAELPDFEPAILGALQQEAILEQKARSQQLSRAERDAEKLLKEQQYLLEAIKQGGELPVLLAALKDVQDRRQSLVLDQRQLQKELPPPLVLPSMDAIRSAASVTVQELAMDSQEFADCMRKVIDKIIVYPVRLCDGGNPVLRAQFTVDLTPHLTEAYRLPSLISHVRRDFVVDLFDQPQRAEFRERVVNLRAAGISERDVAQQFGLTVTATQRAAALHRLMLQMGITDPYVPLTGPVEGNKRYRRHRHERFQKPSDTKDDAA